MKNVFIVIGIVSSKNEHNDPHIVTYVNIRLSKKPRFSVNYGNLKEELAKYPKDNVASCAGCRDLDPSSKIA